MNDAIKQMLEKHQPHSQQDYINALKEIFQEIALLALWRAKFFEHAAFYGGSALRVLYGLGRFSEDLDFSLLQANENFSLEPYNNAIINELNAFGFTATMNTKVKASKSDISSAFLKADSKTQLLSIEAPDEILKHIHSMHTIKIKMEVDTNPPLKFETANNFLLMPIPFSVKALIPEDLFAGKVHAILCRPWVNRVKGRDWYDFVWYISRNTPLNLTHLKERLVQSGAWQETDEFSQKSCIELLKSKIKNTNFDNAKVDILPFIADPAEVAVWSPEFFEHLCEKLSTTDL